MGVSIVDVLEADFAKVVVICSRIRESSKYGQYWGSSGSYFLG
jgi:hypothetical protein